MCKVKWCCCSPRLQILNCARSGVDCAASKLIAQAVAKSSSVVRVNLEYNHALQLDGARAWVHVIMDPDLRLETLAFDGCGFTRGDADHYRVHTFLEELANVPDFSTKMRLLRVRCCNSGYTADSWVEKKEDYTAAQNLRVALQKKYKNWGWVRYAMMGWTKGLNPDCPFAKLSWHVMVQILTSLSDFNIHI